MNTISANTILPWVIFDGATGHKLTDFIEQQVKSKICARNYKTDEVEYIAKANFCPIKGHLQVSEQELCTLRRLCQAWNVEIRPIQISSHRAIIGPLIVAAKKVILPILRVLLKDLVTQQRDFNAAAISMLGTLLSERARES